VDTVVNANDGPDFLDIDADDDGVPDNVEAQTTNTDPLLNKRPIPIPY